jgi:hypothetical protein
VAPENIDQMRVPNFALIVRSIHLQQTRSKRAAHLARTVHTQTVKGEWSVDLAALEGMAQIARCRVRLVIIALRRVPDPATCAPKVFTNLELKVLRV